MGTLLNDVSFGLRTLLKYPGFTLVAVLSLGLGLGAVTSVYSIISAVLLTPLPFEDADRLMIIAPKSRTTGEVGESVAYPEFLEWQNQSETFEYMAGYCTAMYNYTSGKEPDRVLAGKVSHTFLPLLKTPTLLGRNFTSDEDRPGAPKVLLLTHRGWSKYFSRNPGVLGLTMTLDGEIFEIVGVTPEDFIFLPTVNADVYVPIGANSTWIDDWGSNWFQVIGKLKPNVTLEQAQAEMATIADRIAQQRPEVLADRSVEIIPGSRDASEEVETPFLILFGVVAFVLLIACVNVANLLLSRAAARQKEIAIRAALGASRGRIVRQLLTESVLLALIGGGLGLLVATWGMDIIVSLLPAAEAQAYVKFFDFGMNGDVFAFSAAVSMLTGIVFGIAPAWNASNPDLNESLKEGGAGAGSGRHRHRILNVLVVIEVALALVLLIGATLMVQSYARLYDGNPGFDTKNLLTVAVELNDKTYPAPESKIAFFRSLLERMERIPGVDRVGGATSTPMRGSTNRYAIGIEGLPDMPPGQFRHANFRVVTPGYIETLGIPLRSGRLVAWSDSNPDTPVAVVNESFVSRYFNGEDAIGKRFTLGAVWGDSKKPPITIVGVMADVQQHGVRYAPFPEFCVSMLQFPPNAMVYAIRSSRTPEPLAAAVREALHDLDPNQPLIQPFTMDELIRMEIWMDRFVTVLFSMFAGVALFLATIGVYGVINFSVVQRTHEIGIRIALGAQPSRVIAWVLQKGLMLAGIGLCIGVPASLALTRFLTNMLYGISATDPLTFAGMSLLLVVIAAGASWLPARKAVSIDPIVALRCE